MVGYYRTSVTDQESARINANRAGDLYDECDRLEARIETYKKKLRALRRENKSLKMKLAKATGEPSPVVLSPENGEA